MRAEPIAIVAGQIRVPGRMFPEAVEQRTGPRESGAGTEEVLVGVVEFPGDGGTNRADIT